MFFFKKFCHTGHFLKNVSAQFWNYVKKKINLYWVLWCTIKFFRYMAYSFESVLRLVQKQQLRLRKPYQSHFCDCDCNNLHHCNMNSTIKMLWTYICDVASAIAVCERAFRVYSQCVSALAFDQIPTRWKPQVMIT